LEIRNPNIEIRNKSKIRDNLDSDRIKFENLSLTFWNIILTLTLQRESLVPGFKTLCRGRFYACPGAGARPAPTFPIQREAKWAGVLSFRKFQIFLDSLLKRNS